MESGERSLRFLDGEGEEAAFALQFAAIWRRQRSARAAFRADSQFVIACERGRLHKKEHPCPKDYSNNVAVGATGA